MRCFHFNGLRYLDPSMGFDVTLLDQYFSKVAEKVAFIWPAMHETRGSIRDQCNGCAGLPARTGAIPLYILHPLLAALALVK